MSIWRWADWIEPIPPAARLTLGEGNTPLLRSRRIGPAAGLENLYFKLETVNPTGSYKDRFAAVAISSMISEGKAYCLATSSGNTGSALAAYCAAADRPCRIGVVESAPEDKLKQMMAYGADVFAMRGVGSDPVITQQALDLVKTLGATAGCSLQISAFAFSPIGMSGVQTISYELAEQMQDRIDHVFVPAGGGGLTLAIARGFEKLMELGQIKHGPAIECVQPEGNNTIAGPLQAGADKAQSTQCTSQISGLQVPNTIDGDQVITACRASGGGGHLISDHNIWTAQARLGREEGIFCEPAGAVALSAVLKQIEDKHLDHNATIVCVVTGTGFKDQASVGRMLRSAKSCLLLELPDIKTYLMR